ncbi:MAG TPA: hypothetical protein VG102_02860 [Candidatus Paceibacterota bacterium]|jgi:hypothetical protein|nr:hypothetical protein [Candidatus Paceibacterota bacterium]
MQWLRTHLYLATLAAAALLLVGGAAIVTNRAPVAPSQYTDTLSLGGGAVTTYGSAPAQSPQQIVQEVIQNQAPSSIPLPPFSTSSPAQSAAFAQTSGSFDYEALLAQLSTGGHASSSLQTNDSSNAAIAQAYQFIPTGLVATTAPPKKPMTVDQQTLYDYGNEVGGEIQGVEELHTNESQVIKDQAEDRTDPVKAAAVTSLAQGFTSVGTFMQQMQDVPPAATALNSALAQSYLDIGAKLQLVAQAQSDTGFVQAVETYDSTANTFVRNYAALAQFFSANGVVFAPQDPGSVFSFTETNGVTGL